MINTLSKGMKIIEELAVNGPIAVEDIYIKTKFSVSSIYRVLCILEDLNYVTRYRDGSKDIWKLDYKFLNISSYIFSRLDLRNEIRDILINLADETKEIVQLSIMHDEKILFLDVIKRHKSLVNVYSIGEIVDMNMCAACLVLTAYLEEDKLDLLYKNYKFKEYTKNTIKNMNDLKSELKKVKRRGYSYDNQYTIIGHRCIGAPIFNYKKEIIAAINISGHVSTITDDKIEKLAEIVKKRAKEASIKMGCLNFEESKI